MDDKQLRSWVSDQLFALLGFAESSLVGFIVALGACAAPSRHAWAVQSSPLCSWPWTHSAALPCATHSQEGHQLRRLGRAAG